MYKDKYQKNLTFDSYILQSIFFTKIAIEILNNFAEENYKALNLIMSFGDVLFEMETDLEIKNLNNSQFRKVAEINFSYGIMYLHSMSRVELFRLSIEDSIQTLSKAVDLFDEHYK